MPKENTSSFHFYTNQSLSTSRKDKCLKIYQWKRSGKKINLVPEAGDILEREEIVLESEKQLKISCVYNAMNAKNYFIAFH